MLHLVLKLKLTRKRNNVKTKQLYLLNFGFILLLLIIDQIIKIAVKTNMTLGEHIPVIGHWFNLYFIENEGMAFGMSFGGKFGKLALTCFRFLFSGVLIYYLIKFIKEKQSLLVMMIISLIIAGAIGNIIDCVLYGVIFDYAPLMFGNVVDMFYIRLFQCPDWLPIWGGEWFFPAIFNFADSCITIGIILMIIFYPKFKHLKF